MELKKVEKNAKKLVFFTCALHKKNSKGARKPYRNTGKRAYFKIYYGKDGRIRTSISHGDYCIDIAQQSLLTALLFRLLIKKLCYNQGLDRLMKFNPKFQHLIPIVAKQRAKHFKEGFNFKISPRKK